MQPDRYFFINREDKIIQHYGTRVPTPEGFIFCGMSQLPVKAAAGYYARNEEGFSVVNADPKEEDDVSSIREDSGVSSDPEEERQGESA